MRLSIVLLMLLGMSMNRPAHGQAACVDTPFEIGRQLTADWFWIDEDLAAFNASSNRVFQPTRFSWYLYSTRSHTFEPVSDAVIADLYTRGMPANRAMLQTPLSPDFFEISRRGSVLLEGRTDGGLMFYLTDLRDGRRWQIGTVAPVTAPQAFWSADENTIIIQDIISASERVPVQVVRLSETTMQRELLIDVLQASPQIEFLRTASFRVVGMSPDARYVVLRFLMPDSNLWVMDLNNPEQMIDLPFDITQSESLIWVDTHTFLTVTDEGIVEYRIDTQTTRLVTPHAEILAMVIGGYLSPNGEWIVGSWWTNDPNEVSRVRLCQTGY